MNTKPTNPNQLMGYGFATVSLLFILGVFVMLPYLTPDRRTIMNVVVGVLGATLTSFVAGRMLLQLSMIHRGMRIAVSASAGLGMFVFLLVRPVFANTDNRTPQDREVDAFREKIVVMNSDFALWRSSDAARRHVQERAQKLGDEMLAVGPGEQGLDRIRQILKYSMAGYAYLMEAEVTANTQSAAWLAYDAIGNLSKASRLLDSSSDEATKKWMASSEISDFVNFHLALSARVYEAKTGIKEGVESVAKSAYARTGENYKERAAPQNEPYLVGLQ